MMALGRWYYLVSVLRTLRHNGVKEFTHNLTPNEWVQLQFTLDSKPRSFSEGTQDISRHRLQKMNLSILREVWRDTSLWKHNLNYGLEIWTELAACKAQGCIHQERLQVPWVNVPDKNGSYWNRLPVQPNHDLMMSKARNVNWCGENNSLLSLSEPKAASPRPALCSSKGHACARRIKH